MKYICYRDFKGKCISGEVDIKAGTPAFSDSSMISVDNIGVICLNNSYIAERHFAYDEDGNGLLRGTIIYAIAFAERINTNGYRFSDGEQEIIRNQYSHFLRDTDAILFNNYFFEADIDVLKKMAERLNIHW